MTSASELFHTRRFRFGRNSGEFDVNSSDLVSPPPISRHYRHHSRRDRLDPEVHCDTPPPRRSSYHLRQNSVHRPPSQPPQEREPSRVEQVGQQSASGNASRSGSNGNVRSRLRFGGNDALPGAVLLARERLLQRLRSVTLSGSRRSNRRSSSSNHSNSFLLGDDFRLVDGGDWETELSSEWLAAMTPLTGPVTQHVSKRPPGLTQEAFNCLPVEVFCVPEEGDEQIIHQGHYKSVAYVWRVSWRETNSYVFLVGIGTIFAAWIHGCGLVETALTAVGGYECNYRWRERGFVNGESPY